MDYETQVGLLTSLLIAFYIGNVDIAVKRLHKQAEHPDMKRLFDGLAKLRPAQLRQAIFLSLDDLQQQISFN